MAMVEILVPDLGESSITPKGRHPDSGARTVPLARATPSAIWVVAQPACVIGFPHAGAHR